MHRAIKEVRMEPYLSYYKYMNVNILIRALVKLLGVLGFWGFGVLDFGFWMIEWIGDKFLIG